MAPRTSDVADAQVGVVRGPVDADAQGAGDGVLERHAPELLHQQRHHFRRKPRADEEAGQARRGEEKRQVAELLLEATLRSTLGCFFAITESSPLSLEARGGNVVRQVRVGCERTKKIGLLQKSQRRSPQLRVRHVQVPRKHVQRSVPGQALQVTQPNALVRRGRQARPAPRVRRRAVHPHDTARTSQHAVRRLAAHSAPPSSARKHVRVARRLLAPLRLAPSR